MLLWACGGNSGKKEQPKTFQDIEAEFASTLTASDTTQVMDLSTQVMDSLKSGNVEWAVDCLCELSGGDTPTALGEETRERMLKRFKRFPVVDYELDYYSFSTPLFNDLKYRTFFRERDDSGTAPAMSLMFNPVKVDGKWYLCVKEMSQPAKDAENAIDPRQIVE